MNSVLAACLLMSMKNYIYEEIIIVKHKYILSSVWNVEFIERVRFDIDLVGRLMDETEERNTIIGQ